jgi:hypothetical protein
MVLRYDDVQQHLRRNTFRKKKRQKKSIFIYGTTFKKNESGRDFQRGQIWNDRSHKQKKNYGSHPIPHPFYHGQLGISLTFLPFMHGVKT